MRIDFFLSNPLLVDHFLPVVRELGRRKHRAGLVLPEPGVRGAGLADTQEEEDRILAGCRDALERAGVEASSPDLDAEVVVTALSINHVRPWRNHKLKFRYGIGMLRSGFHYRRELVEGFDGLLAHGQFEEGIFSSWIREDRIRSMGMPRHDMALRDGPDRAQARRSVGLDEADPRPVLGYFPTWGEHAAIERFAGTLATLADSHRILVKAHVLTDVRASEALHRERLQALAAHVVASDHPLVDALRASDVVIADAKSGVGPESALIAPGVPLLLTSNLPVSDYYDEVTRLGVLVTEPQDLPRAVEAALSSDAYADKRRDLARDLFAERSGHAAARAADALLELATLPKQSPSPRRARSRWFSR